MFFQVNAKDFENYDDCLQAAVDEYADTFELEPREVKASWKDDNRDIIRVELPDSCWDEGEEEEELYEEDEEWEDEDLYEEDEE